MSTVRELRIPAGVALQVSKALAQLEFVAGEYGRTLLTPAKRQEYAHDFEGHWVDQAYIPTDRIYYEPTDQGHEKVIKERLEGWRKRRRNGR